MTVASAPIAPVIAIQKAGPQSPSAVHESASTIVLELMMWTNM